MQALDFRIVEHPKGRFTVERLFEIEESRWFFLWELKPKKHLSWRRCTKNGARLFISIVGKTCINNHDEAMPVFDTLDQAKAAIEYVLEYEKPPVYHHYFTTPS